MTAETTPKEEALEAERVALGGPTTIRSSPERRRDVAKHEAAHLLVAHLVGCAVRTVNIEPGGIADEPGAEGLTTLSAIAPADPVGALAAVVAGFLCDLLRAAPGEAVDRAFAGAGPDLDEAAVSALALDPWNPDSVLRRAQGVAGHLLDRHWAAHELLADRLLAAPKMSGPGLVDEIEAALDGAPIIDWIVARRALVDAVGLDPAAREAAWLAAGRRWHGSAAPKTWAIYEALPAARWERENAEIVRRREAIEEQAGHPITTAACD